MQSHLTQLNISCLYHVLLKKHMHNILNKKYEATIAILTKKTFIFENFLGRAFWREDKKMLSASFEERGVLGHLYV